MNLQTCQNPSNPVKTRQNFATGNTCYKFDLNIPYRYKKDDY